MASGNYIVSLRCNRCRAVYQAEKYNHVAVGSTSGPNAGQRCPGCQSTSPATVVSVVKL